MKSKRPSSVVPVRIRNGGQGSKRTSTSLPDPESIPSLCHRSPTEQQKTIPWSDDELIIVNNKRLAYHMDSKMGLVVEYGGRDFESLNMLRNKKAKIKMPRILRER